MIRNFATFASTLPDDSVESGGDIVVPRGRNVIESMRSAYRDAGYDVTAAEQHSFYGWCFHSHGKEGRFWHMIQSADEWLLMVEDARPFWVRLFRRRNDFGRFVERTYDIVASIPQVSNVRWFTKDEFEAEARRGGSRGEPDI